MTLRLIIADDHPFIRAGVRMLLEGDSGLAVVAEADSPEQVLSTLRETPADLLITDFSMPGGQAADGLGLLQRIRRDHPHLPIIVLTMISNAAVHGTILETGVRGLVDKSAGMTEISLAIQAVQQGQTYVSTTFRQTLFESEFNLKSGEVAKLSPREVEVLRLFASGMTVTAIAERLSRSIKTVSRQKSDAMVKLGLKSDLDIYTYARENGMIS
ncbi:response regulator transcription factor [Variovorax sp. J2P1-59]|uniref:response regulator transcription factor n=1 Tax=Variovorax flavidus TaxID=3053501 RepID=UPI002577E0E5|nr:response regulator transcription factor [Variovorax sp. J2P1-59]MDM0074995.1 response regulator transcription factor [Variovorax sp. J2P1-59]